MARLYLQSVYNPDLVDVFAVEDEVKKEIVQSPAVRPVEFGEAPLSGVRRKVAAQTGDHEHDLAGRDPRSHLQ